MAKFTLMFPGHDEFKLSTQILQEKHSPASVKHELRHMLSKGHSQGLSQRSNRRLEGIKCLSLLKQTAQGNL